MEYQQFNDTVIIRMDPGEDLVETLKTVGEALKIRLAEVSALGAVNHFTVGAYDVPKRVYVSNTFDGSYEIVSLTGTISTMDGAYYAHLHMSAADETGRVVGGHLNAATISATCEMVVRIIDGTMDRRKDEKTGLNVFRFLR